MIIFFIPILVSIMLFNTFGTHAVTENSQRMFLNIGFKAMPFTFTVPDVLAAGADRNQTPQGFHAPNQVGILKPIWLQKKPGRWPGTPLVPKLRFGNAIVREAPASRAPMQGRRLSCLSCSRFLSRVPTVLRGNADRVFTGRPVCVPTQEHGRAWAGFANR